MAGNKYLNEQGLGHLWERIKIYTSSTYLSLTGGNVTGPVNFGDSVYISDLNAGNFIATGNAVFTNNIQANTINGVEVGLNPKFTDTWNKVSTTQDGYVTKLPGGTTSFLRGDGSWATPPDTTYVFDGTYNSSTNKVATVNTVTNAINNLDGNLNGTTPGVGKTLTAFGQTNGKVSATFGDISITKSQISDFPTSMPASDVPAWAKENEKPSYHLDEIQPLLTKTYTEIIATANDAANAWFFFGSIRPTSWQAVWSIRYRIKGNVPNQVGFDQQAEVTLSGSYDALRTYASYNKVNAYLSAYYHELYKLKQAGFNNGYGHLLGVRLQSSTNPTNTNYKRTFDIEILELKNCTFTFFDNFKLYNTTDIPWSGTTNYTSYSEINYCNNGLQEVGDANDVNYYNRENYASRTTSAALYCYQLCLTKSNGTLVPINSVNNSIATNKTLTTDSFDPFGDIFFWASTSTYSAGANIGNGYWYRQYLADLRYSFNCGGYDTTPTLTARAPLYLVATPQTDGTAKLYTQPLSMELPTSADGLIYIYLGRVYEDTKPYRVVLSPKHPVYEYRDGAVRLYTGLKSKAAASEGTEVSLVTTGEKYLWNSKTNNTGTVTSVAAAAANNSGITISGSPITSEGTITIGLNLSDAINGLGEGTAAANRDNYIVAQHTNGNATYHRRKLSNIFAALNSTDITKALGGNQNANYVFAGPSSGSAATPSFRALDAADIPSLAWSKITTGADDLKAIEALTGTSGLLKKTAANAWTLDTSTYLTGITSSQVTSALGFTPYNATNPNGYTSNTGTVTSVQVQADSPLQSSVNTAQNKTLNTTISFIKQNANVVLAGPSSGSTTASPTFRALVEADIPSLSKSKISDFPTSWDLSNISGADDLKKIEALTGTTGFLKKTNTNTWSLDTQSYIPSNSNGNTQNLRRPLQMNGLGDNTLDSKINTLRANRLAFLPADQIIIEKTTDGGATWVDAEVPDATKIGLFSEVRASVSIPLLNGVKNINCGLRITITAMKYNVPEGTPEISKYNYWNSDHVVSTERYNQLKEMYFWVSSNTDTISVKVERATGKASTTWYTIFENENYGMTGWSGNDYIRFSQNFFGGSTSQTGQFWNYRLTFFTRGPGGSTTLSGTNSSSLQAISEIRGYGDTYWAAGNNYAANDHLYTFDRYKNATFPAQITATQFNGQFNGNATSASSLTNKTLDSSTIDRTAGSFTFQGSTAPWAGTDWVGLQVDSGSDKFQIHALNPTTLQYRQNDSGGTNSNWSDWQSLLSSGNYTDYTVTKTGTGASGSWGIDITGNADTATKATQDGSGNIITNTYLKKTGDTMVGTLSWNSTSLPQFSGSPTYLVGIQGFANGGTMKWQSASSVTVGAATKATQDKNGNDITTKYVTIDTTQTITGRKTLSDLAAVTFKPSSGTDKCNINYDASLGALVFSFVN